MGSVPKTLALRVTVGPGDADDPFRNNRAVGNGREGVLFRNESEPMGGHRNRFEDKEILDSGNAEAGYGVSILGETHDLTFESNRIGNHTTKKQRTSIYVGEHADRFELEDNNLSGNLMQAIENRRGVH